MRRSTDFPPGFYLSSLYLSVCPKRTGDDEAASQAGACDKTNRHSAPPYRLKGRTPESPESGCHGSSQLSHLKQGAYQSKPRVPGWQLAVDLAAYVFAGDFRFALCEPACNAQLTSPNPGSNSRRTVRTSLVGLRESPAKQVACQRLKQSWKMLEYRDRLA